MQSNIKGNWTSVLKQIERSKPSFDAVQEKIGGGIALFGAGQFGRASLEYLKKNGYKVVCFIDNSPQKQGATIDGIAVVAKDDRLARSAGVILITAKHAVGAISASLNVKTPKMPFDAWFLMRNFGKYTNLRENVFNDPRSKECLDGVMLTMLTGDETYCTSVMDFNQYFCLPQFVNVGTDSFVDAGAYVGDTAEKFIFANNGAFKHIYAFEPCGPQMAALKKRKDRLVEEWALNSEDFTIVNAGLGQIDSFANINVDQGYLLGANLKISDTGASNSDIKVFSLDSYIKDKQVTFIKADIEGMEMEMLRGAANTIKSNKPKMALSVYHKPDDLISISEFVLNIDRNYVLALRHHSPLLMDTTLYCWKKNNS